MWISLFTVVLAIALGLGLGAVLMDSGEKDARPYARRRAVRARN